MNIRISLPIKEQTFIHLIFLKEYLNVEPHVFMASACITELKKTNKPQSKSCEANHANKATELPQCKPPLMHYPL
jgi:hypothetical protein